MKKTETKEVVSIEGSKRATLPTQTKVIELAKQIVDKGYGRQAAITYAMEHFKVGRDQGERYYYAAITYLRPDNPDTYREALISRNFGVLESMLQRALENNDLSTANSIINTMNKMLGVGEKRVALETKDEKIIVSFGD